MSRLPADPAVLPVEILEVLLEAQAEVRPDPDTALRLKARILGRARDDGRAAALLTIRSGEGEWIRLGPKVEMKPLHKVGGITHFLMRLAPGAVLPPHGHDQDEECICLEGEVQFGDIVVRAGDFHLAPRGTPHGLMRSRKGALLYLRGADPRDYRPQA